MSTFGKCFTGFSDNICWSEVGHDSDQGDLRSTPLTHSDNLSSLESIARASMLLVLWREAMMGVPVAFSLSGSLTAHQPSPYASSEYIQFSIEGLNRSTELLLNLSTWSSTYQLVSKGGCEKAYDQYPRSSASIRLEEMPRQSREY